MPVATQIKQGQTVIIDGELYKILNLTHITPGKGNAVVQADARSMKSGLKKDFRFRSSENVELADMLTRKMQYLYQGDGVYNFMDQENYEQYELTEDVLSDSLDFLIPEAIYDVDLHEGTPVGLVFPSRMTFKIVETDPAQKGDAGKTKLAKLETGLTVKVPLFLEEGELIVVNTDSKEYVERAKEG